MPKTLTDGQKEFVKEILSLLIDLPAEEKSLSLEVEKLKQALSKTEPLEAKDDYFRLQQCFQKPTTQFLRLETQNPELCIGSVQEYIIEYLDEQVTQAALEAKIDAKTLAWKKDEFLEVLHRHENEAACSTVFHTQRPPSDYDPLQIPVHAAKFYKAEFIKNANFQMLEMKITIDLPNMEPFAGPPIFYPDYVNSEVYEDDFIRSQQPVGRVYAELIVGEILLKELLKMHVINAGQKYRATAAVRQLILYRVYYQALVQGSIKYQDIAEIQMEDIERLANPAIMALIEARKLNTLLAPYIIDPELAVIQHHYYLQEILNNRLNIEAIVNIVSPEKAYVLTLVGVVYLQKMGKLGFEKAKTIPPRLAPIFLSEACLRLFKEDKLLIDELLSEAEPLYADQAQLLADSYYAAEFLNQRLDLPTIKGYQPDEVSNLLFTPFIELQKRKILRRYQVKSASPMVGELLSDEFYLGLLLAKDLDYALIENINPYQVQVLLDPKIKQLIHSGPLKIPQALLLKKKEKEILIKPAIQALFSADKIKIRHLAYISYGLASMLNKNIFFYGLIHQDVISMDECLRVMTNNELLSHPISLWGLNIGSRLFGIFKNKPYQNDEQADNFETIKNDLEQIIEANPQYPRKTIIKQAIVIFSRFLRQKLAKEYETHLENGSVYIQFLRELLEIENHQGEEKDNPCDNHSICRLTQMADLAKEKIELIEAKPESQAKPFTTHSLYLLPPPANNRDLKQIKSFYHAACEILDFNDALVPGVKPVPGRASF